jgi:hypothetical protein
MARKTIAQKLAELEARKKTLQARLGKQERAHDTRRKVLLGALVLHRLENGRDDFSKGLGDWLRRELPGFLARDTDKELFVDLLKPISALSDPIPAKSETPRDDQDEKANVGGEAGQILAKIDKAASS